MCSFAEYEDIRNSHLKLVTCHVFTSRFCLRCSWAVPTWERSPTSSPPWASSTWSSSPVCPSSSTSPGWSTGARCPLCRGVTCAVWLACGWVSKHNLLNSTVKCKSLPPTFFFPFKKYQLTFFSFTNYMPKQTNKYINTFFKCYKLNVDIKGVLQQDKNPICETKQKKYFWKKNLSWSSWSPEQIRRRERMKSDWKLFYTSIQAALWRHWSIS